MIHSTVLATPGSTSDFAVFLPVMQGGMCAVGKPDFAQEFELREGDGQAVEDLGTFKEIMHNTILLCSHTTGTVGIGLLAHLRWSG